MKENDDEKIKENGGEKKEAKWVEKIRGVKETQNVTEEENSNIQKDGKEVKREERTQIKDKKVKISL